MSLYLDADSVKESERGRKFFPKRMATGVWMWRGVTIVSSVIAFIVAYYLAGHAGNSQYDLAYEKQKSAIVDKLNSDLENIQKDLEKNATERYPFIGNSKIHNSELKFVDDSQDYENSNANVEVIQTEPEITPDSIEYKEPEPIRVTEKPVQTSSTEKRQTSSNKPKVETRKQSVEELFNEAVKDTGGLSDFAPEPGRSQTARAREQRREAVSVYELPNNIRRDIPAFVYNAHNYSTDPSRRSVTLNGISVKEGGRFRNLEVLSISEGFVVMRVDGQSFSVKAIDDYSPND